MSDRALCATCGGNGVVKIPGGVSVCDDCDGECFARPPYLHPKIAARLTQLRDEMRREAAGVWIETLQVETWADTLDQILSGEALKGR